MDVYVIICVVRGDKCLILNVFNVAPYVISNYINTKMSVCLSVCLFVCLLYTSFPAISKPIWIPFGTKLIFAPIKVLFDRRLP